MQLYLISTHYKHFLRQGTHLWDTLPHSCKDTKYVDIQTKDCEIC